MKEDNIKRFFEEHKQTIENDGFNERLFSALDCIPAPAPRFDKTKMIISIFATVGIALFVLLGGHNALISGLGSMGSLFNFGDFRSIRPEVVVPVVFMMGFLFALGRFAIKEE